MVLHPNFEDLVESMPDSRIIAFTAHATKLYTDIEYKPTDILLFGPEPGNIPDPMDIMAGPHVAEQVRLPMRPCLRSLNLTNCASIAIYEAWRQMGFKGRSGGSAVRFRVAPPRARHDSAERGNIAVRPQGRTIVFTSRA